MKKLSSNLAMVSTVSLALGELSEEVVFIGGSVVALYLDKAGTPPPNPSEDLDCIVKIFRYGEYTELQKTLREKGFVDTGPEDYEDRPSCRMYLNKMKVDFLPIEDFLGGTNPFYKEGVEKKIKAVLPDQKEVYILPVESYLATKFTAFFDRGVDDVYGSQDMEDIVAVLDGKIDLEMSMKTCTEKEAKYLKDSIQSWLDNWDAYVREGIDAHLPYYGSQKAEKRVEIKSTLEKMLISLS